MKQAQFGLTMVETLVTLAVTAVTLGTAVPSFESAREQRRLDGAAAQLKTDLFNARSLAVAQNRTLRLSVQNDATGSCYVIHSGGAGDCRCNADGSATCAAGAMSLRSVRFRAAEEVRLSSNVGSMVFEPFKGTVTPTGTLRLSGHEHAVHVVVNIMGRARACSAAGGLPSYPAC